MPEQQKKTPCGIGVLAHVSASRGEPHFYSPEKFEFLRAFCFLLYILPPICALRYNRHSNHSPIQWQYQSKGGLSMNIHYIRMGDYYIPGLTLPEEKRPMPCARDAWHFIKSKFLN